MRLKILSALSLVAILLSSTSLTLANPRPKKVPAKQVNPLLQRLPESDAVALIDSRRFFDDALPKILAAKQPLLAEINAKLDEIQQKTSIDLRKFDHLAVGVKIAKVSTNNFDCDPVVIARGTFNAGALVGLAKLASNGTYREEKAGEHTIYIFSVKDIAAKHAASQGITGSLENMGDKLAAEVAVTSLDTNTLAIGTVARVKETLNAKALVPTDLTGLLTPYDHSVMSFAVRTPEGLGNLVPLDNDELGKTLGTIRYVAGSMDINAVAASLQVLARTSSADEAQGVLDTAQGAQQLGLALLGSSKRADRQVLARLVQNAKIAKTGSDVTVDLSIPQSDINALVAMLK
jgi:hypothetical protein